MNQIKANLIRNKILKTNGRFFSVQFVKKDGSLRNLNGRIGVKSHLNGGESTIKHIPTLITVWDVKNKGYRNINLLTVRKFNNENY